MPSNKSKLHQVPKYVTMDQAEFSSVCERVYNILLTRCDKARIKKDKYPSEKSEARHIELAKDAFAFTHMMELIKAMSGEIAELRMFVSSANEMHESMESPEMYSGARKNYIN